MNDKTLAFIAIAAWLPISLLWLWIGHRVGCGKSPLPALPKKLPVPDPAKQGLKPQEKI